MVVLQRIDARGAVLVSLVAGVCVWRYSLAALPAALVLVGALALRHRNFPALGRPVARQAVRFAVFFGAVKLLLDVAGTDMPVPEALAGAGLLAGRLLAAVGIGLALVLYCGPRELCRAVTWYMRPLLRGRAWRLGLGAALVVHFLPLVFGLVDQTGRMTRLRLPKAGPARRLRVQAAAVLRQLAQKSWKQSVAILARDVYRPEAWTSAGLPSVRACAGTVAAGALCIALLFIP